MTLEHLLIVACAVYRITLLINKEAGPFDAFGRFRSWAGVTYDQYSNPVSNSELSAAILCPLCLSVWIAIGAILYLGIANYLGVFDIAMVTLYPFALSGIAVYLFKVAGV